MRKLLLLVSIVAACCFGLTQYRHPSVWNSQVSDIESTGDAEFAKALESRSSGVQIQGQGIVTKVLPDDNDGSRHQRFVVRLGSGQTVLVAHNIDIASRVSSLRAGDTVAFSGEYVWNPKGGVIHWTHHDPSGRHVAGWLKRGDQTYK